jgi:hypothetical protein
VEFFGIELFCGINFLFCIMFGRKLIDDTDWLSTYSGLVLAVGLVFSFVSTIMVAMTTTRLHAKKTEHKRKDMPLQPSRREELNSVKWAFVATTVLIWVTAVYAYFPAEEVKRLMNSFFYLAENGLETQWLRVLSPVIALALGGGLLGTLFTKPCAGDATAQSFQQSTMWMIVLFVLYGILVFLQPLLVFFGQASLFHSKTASTFYNLLKSGSFLGFVGFVFKSLADFVRLPQTSPCLSTAMRPLFITLMVFVFVGILVPSFPFSWIIRWASSIVEYGAPLGLLGVSSYLVYMANKFMSLNAEEVIQ